jgi:hypothetical protein
MMKGPGWLSVLGGCLILVGCDRIPTIEGKDTKDKKDTASQAGHFVIQNIEFKGKWAVLLDSNSGQTWILGTDNNGYLLWNEIGKENYVNADMIATKDPKTGKIDLKPAGKKFRIDTKGNIYDVKDIRTKEDPYGIR